VGFSPNHHVDAELLALPGIEHPPDRRIDRHVAIVYLCSIIYLLNWQVVMNIKTII
jgi:hypothetical protein